MKDASVMHFRLERNFATSSSTPAVCKGSAFSEVLRAFMQDYVRREREGRQASLFERPIAAEPRISRRGEEKHS